MSVHSSVQNSAQELLAKPVMSKLPFLRKHIKNFVKSSESQIRFFEGLFDQLQSAGIEFVSENDLFRRQVTGEKLVVLEFVVPSNAEDLFVECVQKGVRAIESRCGLENPCVAVARAPCSSNVGNDVVRVVWRLIEFVRGNPPDTTGNTYLFTTRDCPDGQSGIVARVWTMQAHPFALDAPETDVNPACLANSVSKCLSLQVNNDSTTTTENKEIQVALEDEHHEEAAKALEQQTEQ